MLPCPRPPVPPWVSRTLNEWVNEGQKDLGLRLVSLPVSQVFSLTQSNLLCTPASNNVIHTPDCNCTHNFSHLRLYPHILSLQGKTYVPDTNFTHLNTISPSPLHPFCFCLSYLFWVISPTPLHSERLETLHNAAISHLRRLLEGRKEEGQVQWNLGEFKGTTKMQLAWLLSRDRADCSDSDGVFSLCMKDMYSLVSDHLSQHPCCCLGPVNAREETLQLPGQWRNDKFSPNINPGTTFKCRRGLKASLDSSFQEVLLHPPVERD